jgi:hypothetical protein
MKKRAHGIPVSAGEMMNESSVILGYREKSVNDFENHYQKSVDFGIRPCYSFTPERY